MKTNLYLLTWMLFYSIAYRITSSKLTPSFRLPKIKKTGVYLSAGLSLVTLIVFISIFGIKNLLFFGSYREHLYPVNPLPLRLFLDKVLRAVPIITLGGLIILREQWENKKLWWSMVIFLIVTNLIVNNPMASSRYWAGVVILGIIILLVKGKKHAEKLIPAVIISGILILFPLANAFQEASLATVSAGNLTPSKFKKSYVEANYDAYEMGVHTLRYTEERGITWGRQLAGPLLFWIPRTLWEGKPIGSGWIIGKYINADFHNLCCPLPFEGYINFGITGLIIFAGITGFMFALIDRRYWEKIHGQDYLKLIYPFLPGFMFFLMRGDLMSTFSYTVMFAFSGLPLLIGRSE